MFEHVVNLAYLVVIVVYAFPFLGTMAYTTMKDMEVIEEYPSWVDDTSWRGFFASPYRMWKAAAHHG